MSNMIIVDFSTLESPEIRANVKNYIIEYCVANPGTLITVVNAHHDAEPIFSASLLDFWGFPRDAVACNPLTLHTPELTFKTMFAASILERDEHKVVVVIDSDDESLKMWGSVNVEQVFNPSRIVEV